MNELDLVSSLLGLDEDDAFFVVRLCDELERKLLIEAHGYPKDSPSQRDLRVLLDDAEYKKRLLEEARAVDASEAILQALTAG